MSVSQLPEIQDTNEKLDFLFSICIRKVIRNRQTHIFSSLSVVQ